MIDNYFICYRIKKLWSNAFMVINDLFSIFSILGMTSHVKTNCLSKGLVYNRKMERSSLGFLRNFHYKSSLNSILDFQFRFILEWKDYFGKKERNTSLNYHTVLYLCYMRPVLFFSFFFLVLDDLEIKHWIYSRLMRSNFKENSVEIQTKMKFKYGRRRG